MSQSSMSETESESDRIYTMAMTSATDKDALDKLRLYAMEVTIVENRHLYREAIRSCAYQTVNYLLFGRKERPANWDTLTPREQYVLTHRAGLDGNPRRRLEDIWVDSPFGRWTGERARQIEAGALNKLRTHYEQELRDKYPA